MAGNKKKKDDSDEKDPYDDEFFERLNEQMKDFMDVMPFKLPANFDFTSDYFKNMFKSIMKQLNIDPKMLQDMSAEDVQDIMKKSKINFKGPFMFGFNMGAGPDGMPQWQPFGNVKPRSEGEHEISPERDPLVDIYEDGEDLVVVCEVPGVSKKDIELKASNNELEIVAETNEEVSHGRKYHKIIPLPAEIDPDYAKARYNNGILEIRLKIIDKKEEKKTIEWDD